MLADLFQDTGNETGDLSKIYSSSNKNPMPPFKRGAINLSGIKNQGATCYLNTLIQTLLHTREFRENLFTLSAEELGLVPNANGQTKLRIIPIELQRLFAQLLLLDQDSCSTNRLTDSFGWTNNEELQQHDVQELNRILFAAIEQSLVNTKQSKLIQELYRGTCVNKVRCLTCLNVFEREEEFLDLQVTVQGSTGLLMSLLNSFLMRENLNGNNQYKCEKCNNEYRDAEKYCQLKTLPPILTFSLLRFTYDLQTYQRIKETGNFEFPLEIDLREYLEDSFKSQVPPGYTEYELFSVIIHSGSAYGGHYHTYIRDFDNIGEWFSNHMSTPPSKLQSNSSSSNNNNTNKSNSNKQETSNNENDPTSHSNQTNDFEIGGSSSTTGGEICLICCDDYDEPSFLLNSNELVNLDYLKYDTPLELLKAFIYNKYKYDEIKIETVCTEITKITGTSWNKRFKAKYGPIEKFLRKYDDTFELLNERKYVKLKPHDRINIVASSLYSNSKNEIIQSCLQEIADDQQQQHQTDNSNQTNEQPSSSSSSSLLLTKSNESQSNQIDDQEYENEKNEKYHWFDFDDSKITPIYSSKLRKQFEGKESAYMLFYRRKSNRPPSSSSSSKEKHYYEQIPKWLRDEIDEENRKLNEKRVEYENKLNKIQIELYLESDFYLDQNVLNLKQQYESRAILLDIDKRTTCVNDLKEILIKYCTEHQPQKDTTQSTSKTNETDLIQQRKEACLNILFDDVPFYWILSNRVDTSSSPSNMYNQSGRFNYYAKSLLNEPSQNIYKLISSNSWSNKYLLILSKSQDTWPIGDEYEPIRIVAKFKSAASNGEEKQQNEISFTFNKCNLIQNLKEIICQNIFQGLDPIESINLAKFSLLRKKAQFSKNENDKLLLVSSTYDHKSLGDLAITNGDFILVEYESFESNNLYSEKLKTISDVTNSNGSSGSGGSVAGHTTNNFNRNGSSISNLCSILKDVDTNLANNKTVTGTAAAAANSSSSNIETIHKINVINNLATKEESESKEFQLCANLEVTESETIANIKIMAISRLNININDYEQCHMRFVVGEMFSEIQSAGACLYDDQSLNEILNSHINNTNMKNTSDSFLDEPKFYFVISHGQAPLKIKNEIAIRCYQEERKNETTTNSLGSEFYTQVVINPAECRIANLTNILVEKLNLKPIESGDDEQYYLKTVDIFDDPETILNNMDALCIDASLKHNDLVLLCKGKLVPPNHYKIKVWISTSNDGASDSGDGETGKINSNDLINDLSDQTKNLSLSTNDSDQIILNDLIDKKYQDFKLLDELIVKNDMKLEDLKVTIQSLLLDRSDYSECEHIRIRILKKMSIDNFKSSSSSAAASCEPVRFQMKKPLFEWHKPLKQLRLSQENDLCVQILNEDDFCLNQGIILIDCVRLNLKTKFCSRKSFKQILWNVNNGATLSSLKESILKAYNDELKQTDLFRMNLAKRLHARCQWILIKETSQNSDNVGQPTTSINCNNNANQTKKKKGNSSANAGNNSQQTTHKTNLKQSPYNLDDGDLIAFTLDTPENGKPIQVSDFLSVEDLDYAKKSNITAAEISRLRKERRNNNDPLGLGNDNMSKRKPAANRRPEVGIKIKIEDFNT